MQEEFQKTLLARPELARGAFFDAGALENRELFLRALRFGMEAQEREIEGAKIMAEEKRLLLVAAKQAREAVTRLRETAVLEYQEEALRWQQDQLDEISSVRYWRSTHPNAEEAK
jgi:flagellar export protein FliJ